LVIAGEEGLWALNADGTSSKMLSSDQVYRPLELSAGVAPAGGRLAYVTSTIADQARGLNLRLLTLPSGEVQTLTPLVSPQFEAASSVGPGDPALEAVRAITEVSSFAWAPDGQTIAFMGVLRGPTSDLYTYSLSTGDLTRLTDGPSQAIRPVWSLDGMEIVHSGVSSLGTGAGFGMEGIWSARADDSGVKELYDIPDDSGDEIIVGWSSPSRFLVYTWSAYCGPANLRSYDLRTGDEEVYWPDYFGQVAHSPETGTALLAIPEFVANCNSDGRQGIFKLDLATSERKQLSEMNVDQVVWSSSAGNFLLLSETGELITVSMEDEVRSHPLPAASMPQVSQSGRYWGIGETGALQGTAGIWVGDFGSTPRKIFENPVDRLTWGPEDRLFFFSGEGLYLARAPQFQPEFVAMGLAPKETTGIAWVWP
jgi:Tol biopolymer transport system component